MNYKFTYPRNSTSPSKINTKKTTSRHIIKSVKTTDKEIMIKASRARGKGHIIHTGSKIRIFVDISF